MAHYCLCSRRGHPYVVPNEACLNVGDHIIQVQNQHVDQPLHDDIDDDIIWVRDYPFRNLGACQSGLLKQYGLVHCLIAHVQALIMHPT